MAPSLAGATPRYARNKLALILLALLVLFDAGRVRASDTLRCGSRLVSVEAIAAEVAATCGEPAYRDQWFYTQPPYGGYAADVEVWYYNFGPSRLLQVLKFRNDRLVDVQTDGYGFYGNGDGRCAPSAIVTGMSKYRLLAECGEPASKRAENVLQGLPLQRNGRGYYTPGYNPVQPVYLEHWIYNFGSSLLLREVTLQNGRVSEVESTDRGFDTP